jgi:anti-sigma-K factor RskA
MPAGSDDDLDFTREQGLLASLGADDVARDAPPAELWDSIAARLDAPGAEARAPDPSTVVAMRHRRRVWPMLTVAAAILAVAAIVAVILVTRNDSTPTTVVAEATLDRLEAPAGVSAEAHLVKRGHEEHLVIDAHGMTPPPSGSFYELWLINSTVTDMHSLGEMTGSIDIVVPPGVDPQAFPVVDISLQPVGSHQHSGHSLLRGTLA